MSAFRSLRDRLAELSDLRSLSALAAWDQRTMMPAEGAPARAQATATLRRISHERATAEEVGGWLAELEGEADGLGDLDRDLLRLARRDWDRQTRVPNDLAAELARAGAEGQDVWQAARATNDFAAFVPALRHNVELARAYAACFDGFERPYDALLADYDHGLTATRIQGVFGPLAEELTPLVTGASDRTPPPTLHVDVATQQAAVDAILRRVGVAGDSWRVDVSAHPFSTSLSRRDTRVTTRFEDGQLESVLAALHEFGHGLYERQIDAELARTNLGHGTSMSIHESQSKFWENHVGRHAAFMPVLADELTNAGMAADPDTLYAVVNHVRPSLIRISADQVTYPLHIVLRFELELELIDGTLDVADLPEAWNAGMRRLLGVEVPDDAHGVLQDVHWAGGAFGYFPSYALGCLIAAQLFEQLEVDLGPQDDAIRAAELDRVRAWLGDKVHRYGRRRDTEPLLEQVTGRGLDTEPFLRHVRSLHG